MKSKINQIALLGTSADPPTQGHQALLEGLLNLYPKVVTWASNNPIKIHGTSLNTRHKLLKVLVESIDNENLELIQELSSPWTLKTLEDAHKRWPKNELIFVIGSDLIEQIPNWLNAKVFLKKARIGIAPRKGWPVKAKQINILKALGGKIDLLPLQIPSSASSKIRKNEELKNIPRPILKCLLEKNLYGINNITKDR